MTWVVEIEHTTAAALRAGADPYAHPGTGDPRATGPALHARLRDLTLRAEGDSSELDVVLGRGGPDDVWVARDADGRVVGWASVYRPPLRGDAAWFKLGVFVESSARGRGVGRALADAAVAAYAGKRDLRCAPRRDDEAGRRLYAPYGLAAPPPREMSR